MFQKSIIASALFLTASHSFAQEATLIAPMIEGATLCQSAIDNRQMFSSVSDGIHYCNERNETGTELLEAKLAKLGPATSPNGQFELGYMLGLPLLAYINVDDQGAFSINRAAIQNDLKLLQESERKSVLYLFSNHFVNSGSDEQARQIASDPNELMTLADGSSPADDYFSSTIYPWRVNAPNSKFSQARALAVNAVMEELCSMPESTLAKVKAITTLGEVHYFFKNFKQGMGYNNEYRITDYSPASLQAFQDWLKERFSDINRLNIALNADYQDFNEIQFPKENTVALENQSSLLAYLQNYGKPDVSRLQHIDHNAYGSVPFFGWASSRDGSPIEIKVYLDGRFIDNAQTGLTRLDVAQALDDLDDGSTGYRYDLDYRNLSNGEHQVELRFVHQGKEYLLDRYTLDIVASETDKAAQSVAQLASVPSIRSSQVRFSSDYPPSTIKVRYNPLAELWLEFRESQVTNEIEHFADLIGSHCIAQEKIFSHQIAPDFNPTWNSTLFAASGSLEKNDHYNLGLNLYGGAIYKDELFEWLEAQQQTRYGIPEMHPMLPEKPTVLAEALQRHHQHGAVFLSPYFMSLIPDDVIIDPAHDKYRLSPINSEYGSKEFYQAIQQVMQE